MSVLSDAARRRCSGRSCRREAPISIVRDGVLIDGQIDLAFETGTGWMVVDFKTNAETSAGRGRSTGARSRSTPTRLSAITGKPAAAMILRV